MESGNRLLRHSHETDSVAQHDDHPDTDDGANRDAEAIERNAAVAPERR